MASYSPKVLEKKYNNWVKAQLAVLFTKEGIEPFVCNEIQQFQQKCLDDICYSNGLFSGTLCSNCCTEDVIKCPTNRICNVGRGQCSYHRNAATRYNPAGCPNKICHNFTTQIQNVHRYYGPSYKNTDATQWCRNSWEIAKCFMPPDGYKDVACAQETDFNGIISVIMNYKDFQFKVHEKLGNDNNIFEQARDIGRTVRHSSKLEVEDKELQKYFKVLQQLLSDPVYLATDIHAQSAKQKLSDLENDTLVIGIDDVRKALDDVANAVQDKIKTEIDGQKKQSEEIKLDMVKRKQDDLRSLESKTSEGVKTLENLTIQGAKKIKEESDNAVNVIESSINTGLSRIKQETNTLIDSFDVKTKNTIEESVKTLTIQSGNERESITQLGKREKTELVELGETLEKMLYTRSIADKEEQVRTNVKTKNTIEEYVKTLTIQSGNERESITQLGKREQPELVELGETFEKIIYTRSKADKEEQVRTNVKTKNTIEESVKTLTIQSGNERESITQLGKREQPELVELGETLEKMPYTRSIADKEEQYITSIKKLRHELIMWYNTNQSTVPLSPLTNDDGTPLAGFYIMPEIDIHTYLPGGRKETTRVDSLRYLFTSSRKIQQEIYLSAAAGFGKTAFSKYLAITWCQAHKNDENYKHFKEEELKALSSFEFLFLVLLRDISNVCDVDDMIEQQVIQYLPYSSSMPKDLLKGILHNEKCLVILDGLDEWTHPDNNCTKLPKSIPHRYAREKCVILTTTRPWKLGVSNLKTYQIDKTVELVKMNRNNVRQFTHNAIKILKGNILGDEVCRFEEEIRNHDLEDMESTPLLLLYLMCLWLADVPIGNSAVELYTGIIQLLLSRTEKLHGMFHSSCETSPDNVPECFRTHQHFCSYYTFLKTIGKLAFYTLFSKKREHTLVFDSSVANQYLNQEDLKSSCLSGILSESKVKTLIKESFKISFSHKTVQEYFSAIFISFQTTSEVQKIIFEECNSLKNILNMSKVFVFISNMNSKLMSAISSELMPVINNDEITSKYRKTTDSDDMYIEPLRDIQDIYISCAKESRENQNLQLCLQDFFINEKCQQEKYFNQLQHLCQQNKENLKSIMILNKDICSLREIINLFTFSGLPHIEKLFYKGEVVENEIMSLLLNPLTCLTVMPCKWENHTFVERPCRLPAEINGRLVKLQHLECLFLHCFTMTHEVMETLLNVLISKKSMKEITLYNLSCGDHGTLCRGFNLDLSQHSQLKCLGLSKIPVSRLNMDISLLEECAVGKLYEPGVVSSYLSQLSAASKLQTFLCSHLDSPSDIEKMLQTLPLFRHMKEVMLWRINLGERSITLTPQMVNIERVFLWDIIMSCSVLYDLIDVINKLPQTVTVRMEGCHIKPETKFEDFKTFLKQSDNFVVTSDNTMESGEYMFEFKTTKNTE